MKKCNYHFKRGWNCIRARDHDGPCGLNPAWWNWSSFAIRYRRDYHNL